MTEVFVLWEGSYSDRGIVGIHATLDGAVAAVRARHPADATIRTRIGRDGLPSFSVDWTGQSRGETFPCSTSYDVTRHTLESP